MRWSHRFSALTASLLFSLGSFASASLPDFDAQSYLAHVKYLSSDALEGRGDGAPGLEKAAEYIAARFKDAGLQPAGDAGTYFQSFRAPVGSQLGPDSRLTFRIGQETIEARPNRDFVPFAAADKDKVHVSGQMVFVGYGIAAEEYKYDDYKNFDVTDKIVLLLTHEPRETDPTSPFEGTELTMHGHDRTKAMNAKYRSARAVLIVEDPVNHDGSEESLTDPSLAGQVEELGIDAVRISRSLAQRLLETQHRDLPEIQKQIDAKMAPASFPLANVEAEVYVDATRILKTVRNVVGLLPGTVPAFADETVVIGAHYDHLGRGGRSSMDSKLIGQIHNGADDNASGVAGVLELAAAFARDPAPRKRGYLFITFAAEELGLNGSAYWASHPTRLIDKVIAMLNMDMIGRVRDNQIILGGIGTSPSFPALVDAAAKAAGLELKSTRSGYGASDHTSFYVKNVPVLFFFSGLHSDYHRPTDDWDRINAVGATKVLTMVYDIASQLDDWDGRLPFTKVDEPMTTGNVTGAGGGYGTYFGSIPDMTAEVKGVRFADIRPGSPAAKAGLQAGDVMVRFAGKEVANLQDFSYLLRTHKPGDVVEVTVMRNDQPLTVEVKLENRGR
jgi:hypothetical protein